MRIPPRFFSRMSAALAGVLSLLFLALPVHAGNIVITGHDDDFHSTVDNSAAADAAMSAFANFTRSGAPNSNAPVLIFDHGTELTTQMTKLGIPFTNVDPNAGPINTSSFDANRFSAFIVASDTTVGGGDNDSTSSANLSTPAVKSAIASFFNSGGGIVGLAGATNTHYYDFLPASASSPGTVTNPNGFTQTPAGAALKLPAVNGDFPHNFFSFPGTGGVDPHWIVTETYTGDSSVGPLTNQPFTLAIAGGSISGGGFASPIPEPATIVLTLLGFGGSAAFARFRRK